MLSSFDTKEVFDMEEFSQDLLQELMNLTRLSCSEAEQEQLINKLKKVVDFVDKLDEVDTSNIDNTIHLFDDLELKTREDEVDTQQLLKREDFLEKNAPSHIGSLIRVPPIGIK
ncbi:Asp-tRNA(Asn)/Glu-tRNA(Gln) amidotransferase GatCAB subunit C [Candidatus Aerophobetes bacterium]|uniref:Aspartyl/glutamyl-tRNA(Asn/Gln) amidotransferase subunit C n=1 Tax=Aerophobetes bacterium TaxID=2030807 RepID=A0A2A4X2G0_UNCAE|nr:MAG: Asp-tRNA(Asn)/Glu-tRNA(Gln) amidotransferase GatCAB subunit C [Candidatus Aerophobetes bacterium]